MNKIATKISIYKNALLDFFHNKEKKFLIFKKLFTIFFAAIVIVTSGYGALEFYFSNTISAILYLLLFLFSFLLFVYNLPATIFRKNEIKSTIKKMKSFKNIVVIVISIFLLLSIVVTMLDGNNFNGTIRFLLILISAILIISSISFETFSKIYCYALFFICLVSLSVYCVALTLTADGATNFFIESNGSLIYSYSFINFFVRTWYTYRNGESSLLRLSGPFWEPSIFAAVIIVGLVLLILSNSIQSKIKLSIPIIFSLILTFSTGGYFLSILLIPLLLSKIIKNKKIRSITLLVFCVCFVIATLLFLGPLLPFLIELFPTIFGKFEVNGGYVRFNSFGYLLKVFAQSPIFGSGIYGAQAKYINLFSENSSDTSLTSTYGLLIAAFGIPGLLFVIFILIVPLFTKYRNISTNIFVVVIFTILMNLQNMLMLSSLMIVLMFIVKEGLYGTINLSYLCENSNHLTDKLLSGKTETSTVSKNMVGLLVIKGISMLSGIFTIPVYNSYFVTDELYGSWAVIISILSWVLLLDFGFGSGLRAKLADAIDENNYDKMQKLISSTYFGSFFASLAIFIVAAFFIWILNLNSMMGISTSIVNSISLKISMTILALGLASELFLKTIVFIHYGEKKSILGSSYTLISSILLILTFFVFKTSFDGNKLLAASIIYSLAINMPLLLGSIIYFCKKENRCFMPTIKKFDSKTCKSVMSFGIVFFLSQVGYLLIGRTDSLFISSLYGPALVSDFSKYSKVYYVIIGLMGSVVQQPIWSAISTSVTKKNVKGVKKYMAITFCVALFLFVCCLLYSVIIQQFFNIWLGSNTISVNYVIVTCLIFYSIIMLFADSLIIIANSLKILKTQAIAMMTSGIAKLIIFFIIPYIPSIYSFGWAIFLIIDALCFVPIAIALSVAIFRKILKLKKGAMVNNAKTQ